ncbi:MAG: BT1926 family outer membrane beta-barrel protein [Flavobacteriales bacterium]|nr:BT1926 family outer membrane beta-barrel protein [Flavobacteriales bacterium]
MKKSILLIAIALLMSFDYATAQKQVGGDKNFELEFTPLGNTPVGISKLRFRSFNGDGTGAIRVGLWVGGTSVETVTAQPGTSGDPLDADSPELLTTNKTFAFEICPGYEMHFDGTDRLSPYVGAQIVFGTTSDSEEIEIFSRTSFSDDEEQGVWTTTSTDGTSSIGFSLLAGFDYYIHDNIYLGAEMYFGYKGTKIKDGQMEASNLDAYRLYYGIPEDDEVAFDPFINGRSSMWGPMAQGTIRVGVLIN